MASIREYKTKNGVTYRAELCVLAQRVNATFDTLREAERWSIITEDKIRAGLWPVTKEEEEQKTLAEVLRDYRDGHATTIKDRGIRERIDAIITRWPTCEKINMSKVTLKHYDEYIKSRKNNVCGTTINRELSIISSAVNRAISEGLNTGNLIEKIIRPKNNRARDRRLEAGEMVRLLKELTPRKRNGNGQLGGGVDNKYVRWVVRFAIETAMRRGEILGLQWEDIKLNGKRSKAILHDTKNGDRREVPLSTRARRCLQVVKKLSGDEESSVFTTSPNALKKCFERACERAGINDLHFHDLRHEATTRLAELFQINELAKITGHKDLKMLLRYYHPRAEDLALKLH